MSAHSARIRGKPQTKGVTKMARTKSEFVSGMGTGFEILKKISEAVVSAGGSDADLRKIIAKESLLPEAIARLLVEKAIEHSTISATTKYFTALTDEEVPADLQPTLAKWRHWATALNYDDSIAYRVKAGYTLKHHAPKHGPCFENFQYLQDWNFIDEPTEDCTVFWIPRIIPGSFNKTADEQLKLLTNTRDRLELPPHHLTSFGSAALVVGLILTHFERTGLSAQAGERLPLDLKYVRTNSRYPGGCRLYLGIFVGDGLYCGGWWDGGRCGGLGVFGLGVEPAC
jgi:hypothetical protein